MSSPSPPLLPDEHLRLVADQALQRLRMLAETGSLLVSSLDDQSALEQVARLADRVEAYQLNVAGYLLKPVTFQDFVDVMATLNKYWELMEMP